MRAWLASLPPRCRGVDVETLRAALESLQTQLDRWNAGGAAPALPLPAPRIGTD
jgi:hypothetical protein